MCVGCGDFHSRRGSFSLHRAAPDLDTESGLLAYPAVHNGGVTGYGSGCFHVLPSFPVIASRPGSPTTPGQRWVDPKAKRRTLPNRALSHLKICEPVRGFGPPKLMPGSRGSEEATS